MYREDDTLLMFAVCVLIVAFMGFTLYLGVTEENAKLYAKSNHYFETDCDPNNGSMK